MTPQDRHEQWKADLDRLYVRLDRRFYEDQAFWELATLVKLRPDLAKNAMVFLKMVERGYISSMTTGLRAMMDTDRRTLSYRRLLHDLRKHHSDLRSVIPAGRCPTKRHLSQWEHEMADAVKPAKSYADAAVAHWSRTGPDPTSFLALREALWKMGKHHQRLYLVLVGSGLGGEGTGPMSVWQGHDWKSTLRTPWWPDLPEQEVQDAIRASSLDARATELGWQDPRS